MGKTGILSGIGDELKGLGRDAVKQVVTSPKDLAKGVVKQIGLEHEQGVKEAAPEVQSPKGSEVQEVQDQANKEFVEALYGSSKGSEVQSTENTQVDENLQKELAGKTPEEQQDIIQKRQALQQSHTANYYQPLIEKIEQGRKTPEDQERTADRVERLEMKDLEEKKKEEEKKKPIALDRAERSIEANRGASG